MSTSGGWTNVDVSTLAPEGSNTPADWVVLRRVRFPNRGRVTGWPRVDMSTCPPLWSYRRDGYHRLDGPGCFSLAARHAHAHAMGHRINRTKGPFGTRSAVQRYHWWYHAPCETT